MFPFSIFICFENTTTIFTVLHPLHSTSPTSILCSTWLLLYCCHSLFVYSFFMVICLNILSVLHLIPSHRSISVRLVLFSTWREVSSFFMTASVARNTYVCNDAPDLNHAGTICSPKWSGSSCSLTWMWKSDDNTWEDISMTYRRMWFPVDSFCYQDKYLLWALLLLSV
jgi:hypothetical protein